MTLPRLWWLLLLLLQSTGYCDQSVTLAWDRSPDADVTGYRLYYGVASGAYTNVTDVGNVDTATLGGLKAGVTYYFAATAYDGSGLESDFSNEVSYTVPVPGEKKPDPASGTKAVDYRDMKAEDDGP